MIFTAMKREHNFLILYGKEKLNLSPGEETVKKINPLRSYLSNLVKP